MQIFNGISELEKAVGTHLGFSGWLTVTQEQIDLFADATSDHQWIHVDTDKAARGPFGTTIAHGFLTLSLIPELTSGVYRVDGMAMGINYGLNKVRFPTVVPSGSRVRAGVEIVSLLRGPTGGQLTMRVTVEREGSDKPACVAETVALLVP